MGLEDFKSGVIRAQGAARNELGKAFDALVQKQNEELSSFGKGYNPDMIDSLRFTHRNQRDELQQLREDPEILDRLLSGYYAPKEINDRISRGDWLSDEEIAATAAEGTSVPAVVAAKQALALSNVNPDT